MGLIGKQDWMDILNTLSNPHSLADKDLFWHKVKELGTPLIIEQDNETYEIIFIHQSSAQKILLKSEDLHDRLHADEATNQFTQIDGTDINYLCLRDIPKAGCAQYSIIDPNNPSESQKKSWLTMPDGNLPVLASRSISLSSMIEEGYLSKENFHSESSSFPDRDVFIYKPDNFNPHTGKVVFLLDGKAFAESMTPILIDMNDTRSPDSPVNDTTFIFIDSKIEATQNPPIPDRVNEFYFLRNEFAHMLAQEIIPHYCERLGITNKDKVILGAHSLAAYPVLNIAWDYSSEIGGVILASPALNQKLSPDMPNQPSPRLRTLPIFMQIGQLEDKNPPSIDISGRDMQGKSRLDATREFHDLLQKNHYNVAETLSIHNYGHDITHVFQGITEGLLYIQEHPPTNELIASTSPAEATQKLKLMLENIKTKQTDSTPVEIVEEKNEKGPNMK